MYARYWRGMGGMGRKVGKKTAPIRVPPPNPWVEYGKFSTESGVHIGVYNRCASVLTDVTCKRRCKNVFVGDKLGHMTLPVASRYVNHDAASLRDLSDQMESRASAPMGGEHREGIVFPLSK
jgi:hypothetical protein